MKIGNCCNVTYGDGGYDEIRYPLYLAKHIHLSNNDIFKEKLISMGDLKNDWHPNAPVQEIVDPELYPVYFLTQAETNNLSFMSWGNTSQFKRGRDDALKQCISPERFKYHWKTSEFLIGKHLESVSIRGQIPGVDDIELKGFFERVFHRMLPAFSNIGLCTFKHILFVFKKRIFKCFYK